MINRVSMTNIAFGGYISDNLKAAQKDEDAIQIEIDKRRATPLPEPPKRNLIQRLWNNKPVLTQESELDRLASELDTKQRILSFYERLQTVINRLGVTEEFVEKVADRLHKNFCPELVDSFASCDYDIVTFTGPTSYENDHDKFILKAIRILHGLKNEGVKFDAKNVTLAVSNLKK